MVLTQTDMVQQYLDQQVKQTIDKEIKKIEEEVKRQLPKIMVEIRKEIFNAYKLITGTIIEQVFYDTYGNVFDLSSLQHSLVYYPTAGLKPQMSYNPNIFRFNDKFFRDTNKFNENARNWERKNRKYLDPSFYTDSGSMADYFEGLYDPVEANEMQQQGFDEFDYMEELMMDYEGMVSISKRNKSYKVNLDDTYKRAIRKANQGFEMEWNRSIKGRLAKKYDLKID